MINASEIIGKQVINNRNQITSYTVCELIYQRKDLKVIALRLNTTKRSKIKSFLPFKKIIDINQRGVMIHQVEEIVKLEQVPKLEKIYKGYKNLIGFEVYNSSMDLLGVLKDYQLDLKSGEILNFVISEGFFSDITTGYSILPALHTIDYSEGIILLNDSEEQLIFSSTGGLKKLLGIEDRI